MLTVMQALKKIKHLDRKIAKNQQRIQKWCSFIDPQEAPPQYELNPLMQAVTDLLAERARLRHALHSVNALHKAEFRGKEYTIDELLIRATVTIPELIKTQQILRRKEKPAWADEYKNSKVVLQYDPNERDKTIDGLENELDEINTLLDDVNVSTDIEKCM